MGKILHLIASPREGESRTLQISTAFLEAFKSKHSGWVLDELDLTKEEIPELSMKRVDGKYALLSGQDLFGSLKEEWEGILRHIQQFLSADLYLVSTPMWNFSIPYRLKQYIDVIVQPKYLFRYREDGSIEGLAKNKKMIVISTSGGTYKSKESQPLDHEEPYLRTIFNFVGITDITFIKAEGMDMGNDELRVNALQKAKNAAQEAANKVV